MSDASSVHRAALSIDGAREAGKLAPWLWTGGTLLSDGRLKALGLPREVLTPEELAAAYGVKIHVMDHPVHGTPLVLSG